MDDLPEKMAVKMVCVCVCIQYCDNVGSKTERQLPDYSSTHYNRKIHSFCLTDRFSRIIPG